MEEVFLPRKLNLNLVRRLDPVAGVQGAEDTVWTPVGSAWPSPGQKERDEGTRRLEAT